MKPGTFRPSQVRACRPVYPRHNCSNSGAEAGQLEYRSSLQAFKPPAEVSLPWLLWSRLSLGAWFLDPSLGSWCTRQSPSSCAVFMTNCVRLDCLITPMPALPPKPLQKSLVEQTNVGSACSACMRAETSATASSHIKHWKLGEYVVKSSAEKRSRNASLRLALEGRACRPSLPPLCCALPFRVGTVEGRSILSYAQSLVDVGCGDVQPG